MNKTGDNTALPRAHRCTRQPSSQEESQGGGLKKSRNPPPIAQASDAQRCTKIRTVGPAGTTAARCVKDRKAETGKRLGKGALVPTDGQRHQTAQRKLSDASNASEDLSKDSGCMSGKVSCSDSSSEISDCTSEGNKLYPDPHSSDPELSGSGGGPLCLALDTTSGDPCTRVPDMKNEGIPSTCAWQENAIYSGGDGYNSSGCCGDSLPSLDVSVAGYSDLTEELLGETPEDLVREAEDLRSENEYLKDELEELHCEMLEMRDMFMEEEVYQLQDLRLQLDQANKMCRILQYRLRKSERRSIRVAQTGQVDGELVRTLEHDMKVAKSVSVRLHNELESVMQRNSQLLWENEGLRERLQDLEVSKQVLQVELEKARESSLKRRSVRSPTNKTEKKLTSQDDSADLRCQLHFAKEESALMCKKLTKLAFECEKMHEDLTRYRSTYGDIGSTQSSEASSSSPFAREADVKVHLRLVEEEATLLSRRIVELEVENRGLRAEMSDLRERGAGGGEEREQQQEGVGEHLVLSAQGGDREKKDHELRRGYTQLHDGKSKQNESVVLECSQANMELHFSNRNQSQVERMFEQSQITREGPVGGEQDSQESDSDKQSRMVASGFIGKDLEAFLDLRDHACLMCSALQLLTTPVNNGGCCSPLLSPYLPRLDTDPKAQVQGLDSPQQETLFGVLELLQCMLMAFIGKMESLISSGLVEKDPSQQTVDRGWDSNAVTVLSGASALNYEDTKNRSASPEKETVEDLSTAEVMGKEEEAMQELGPLSQWNHLNTCRDPVVRLTLQMLWVLHQRCGGKKNSSLEKKEVRDTAMRLLRGVLLELRSELQEESLTEQETMAAQSEMAQSAVHTILDDRRSLAYERTCPKGKKYRHNFCAFRSSLKNRCYLSVDSVQLDPGDQFKTWDHPIMPLSFPDLDVDQMIIERSHTAPEKTSLCIYYSPPSARRVQLAQLKKSPILGKNTSTSISPCHKPTSSVSPRCLRLSANLSDDMKEMTASFQAVRQAVRRSSSLERRKGRLCEDWVIDVASASTQTLIKQPQMVSVGLQTDSFHSVGGVRASPSRLRSSSLVSSKSLHLSSSMEKIPSRTKPGSVSPKFYCRPSSSSPSSPSSFLSSTSSSSHSSSSMSTLSKDQEPLNPSQRASVRSSWGRPTSTRSGQGLNSTTLISDASKAGNHNKPPSKPAGTNRYGLVTEFLRRVSGRADKPASGTGQKAKSGLKNLERLPSTRPPAGPLHRNDSITRIVNQRFMKQREEAGRIQKEEKGLNTNQGVKGFIPKDQNTVTQEDRNDECSSKTLTFCFARPPRTTQHQVRLPHHGYAAAGTESGDPICEEWGKRGGSAMDS